MSTYRDVRELTCLFLQSYLTGRNAPGPGNRPGSTFYNLIPGTYGIFWYFNGIPGKDKVGIFIQNLIKRLFNYFLGEKPV